MVLWQRALAARGDDALLPSARPRATTTSSSRPNLAPLVTVLAVVVLANAINLIDAAGIVATAGGAFFLYTTLSIWGCWRDRTSRRSSPSSPSRGVRRVPASQPQSSEDHLMGDAAALFLQLLATTTITVGGRARRPVQRADLLLVRPAVHPLVILGIPILDTAYLFITSTGARHSALPTRTTCTTA